MASGCKSCCPQRAGVGGSLPCAFVALSLPRDAPELMGDCAGVQLTQPPPSSPSLGPVEALPAHRPTASMFRERVGLVRGLCLEVGRGQVLGVLLSLSTPLLEHASHPDGKVSLPWLDLRLFRAGIQPYSALHVLYPSAHPPIHQSSKYLLSTYYRHWSCDSKHNWQNPYPQGTNTLVKGRHHR